MGKGKDNLKSKTKCNSKSKTIPKKSEKKVDESSSEETNTDTSTEINMYTSVETDTDTSTEANTDTSTETNTETDTDTSTETDTDTSTETDASKDVDIIKKSKKYYYELIKDDGKTEIEFIFHISDIHIRDCQRREEYLEVFNRLFEFLRKKIKNIKGKCLIVITGDVLHTGISDGSSDLAFTLARGLENIAPVILIAGNHDCNMNSRNENDSLTILFVNGCRLENLHYLKKSGAYQYQNIIFGVTSVLDTEIFRAKYIDASKFNGIKRKKYKIGLYHGALNTSSTDQGHQMISGITGSDFAGYDYVMLGDIHKHQYIGKNSNIAYAGSLIQQNHGETLNNHGVLCWNLPEKTSEMCNIKNDYGYCTLNIINGKVEKSATIPKKARVRFVVNNTTQDEYKDVVLDIQKEHTLCEIKKMNKDDENTNAGNIFEEYFDNSEKMSSYNVQLKYILKYFASMNVDKTNIEAKKKFITLIHKKYYDKFVNEIELKKFSKENEWKILELRFSNMLSYGKDNIIPFEKFRSGENIGIIAPNHYGKSAILDIIIYCLYEKFTRSYHEGKMSECIVNKKETTIHCSLLISVGNITYLIERTGYLEKKGTEVSLKKKVHLYTVKIEDGKVVPQDVLTCKNKDMTNKKIIDLVGDYDDFLATCICLQHQDQTKHNSFLNMTSKCKNEYLTKILGLKNFSECYDEIKNEIKGNDTKTQTYEEKLEKIKEGKSQKQMESDIEKMKLEVGKLKECIRDIKKNIVESPDLIKYDDLSEYTFKTVEDIDTTIDELTEEIRLAKSVNHDEIKSKLEECKTSLKKMVKNNPTHDYDAKIKKYNLVLQDLNKKYHTNLPETVPENKLKSLIKKKNANVKTIDKMTNDLSDGENFNVDRAIKKITDKIEKKQQECIICSDDDDNEQLQDSVKAQRIVLTQERKLIKSHVNDLEYVNKKAKKIDIDDEACTEIVDSIINKTSSKVKIYNKRIKVIKEKLSDNTTHEEKIKLLQEELDSLNELKKNIDDNEIIKCTIRKIKENNKKNEENNELNEKIEEIKQKVETKENCKTTYESKIKKLQQNIAKYSEKTEDVDELKTKLKRVNAYKIIFSEYLLQKKKYDDQQTKLKKNEHQLFFAETTLEKCINKYDKYKKTKKMLDDIKNEKKLNELYRDIVHPNSLPYEILKSYVLKLQKHANSFLTDFTDFKVIFIFCADNGPQKSKEIILNIVRDSTFTNMICASGYEKFIINMAFRIAIREISCGPKANFFIIDEGWSCLDRSNLDNVNPMIEWFAKQYDHVIIISHLRELENKIVYPIKIIKEKNGQSAILGSSAKDITLRYFEIDHYDKKKTMDKSKIVNKKKIVNKRKVAQEVLEI